MVNVVGLPPVVFVVVVLARIQLNQQVKNIVRLEEEVDQEADEDDVAGEVQLAASRAPAPSLGHKEDVEEVAAAEQDQFHEEWNVEHLFLLGTRREDEVIKEVDG